MRGGAGLETAGEDADRNPDRASIWESTEQADPASARLEPILREAQPETMQIEAYEVINLVVA